MQWFAVYTKPQKEFWAEENIQRIGFETFLPLIKVNGKNGRNRGNGKKCQISPKPLFPRYLFAHFDLTTDYWTPVRYARGVVKVVSFADNVIPVPDEIIAEIKNRQDCEGFIQLDKLPSDPSKGDRVRVINGPFRGLEGIFIETLKDEERVIVLLNLLRNRAVPTRLEREQVVKV